MVESQTRGMLALAVALLVVVGLLFAQGPEGAEADPDATVPVWTVDADRVERVRIERADDTLELVREGHRWRMVSPAGFDADPEQVVPLIDGLAAVARGVPVASPEAPEAYGLGDVPEARVTLTMASGLTPEASFGLATPVGYRTYAQTEDGRIVAVAGGLHDRLVAPAASYRDHRVFHFDPTRVRRVVMRSPEGVLDLKGEGATWFLEGYGRADADQVDDVVVGLLDLRFDQYLDAGQRLDAGRYEVEVHLADGSSEVVHVGDTTPMGVVMGTPDGRFGMLYPEALKQLARGPRSVLDPSAFPVDMDRADEVTVELDGRTFHATRNGPTWRSEQVADDVAWAAVAALAEVGATHRHEPPVGAAEGTGKVTVRADGALRVVWLGEVQGDVRLARDAAGGVAYRVVESDLQAFADRVW